MNLVLLVQLLQTMHSIQHLSLGSLYFVFYALFVMWKIQWVGFTDFFGRNLQSSYASIITAWGENQFFHAYIYQYLVLPTLPISSWLGSINSFPIHIRNITMLLKYFNNIQLDLLHWDEFFIVLALGVRYYRELSSAFWKNCIILKNVSINIESDPTMYNNFMLIFSFAFCKGRFVPLTWT